MQNQELNQEGKTVGGLQTKKKKLKDVSSLENLFLTDVWYLWKSETKEKVHGIMQKR